MLVSYYAGDMEEIASGGPLLKRKKERRKEQTDANIYDDKLNLLLYSLYF